MGHEHAVMHVQDRVRDEVRLRGIDPFVDVDRVRSLVDSAVSDLALRDAEVAADPSACSQAVLDAVAGYGALQPLLDDPSVEELWINEPGRVFVARDGRSELTTVVLDAAEVRRLVERMLRVSGRRLDLSSPFVDASMPDGSRLHVVIPDITREHWAVNIRRFVVRPRDLSDLVRRGTMSQECAEYLDSAVLAGRSIVIAGGTQAGKTTLLNALLTCIPATERVISCEEVFEVRLDGHPDWVALQTRDASSEGVGEVSLRRLVKEALRMRPTRVVVGEVRQAEALDLLVAMNSGMPAMSTLHANSGREALLKLCTLPLLAGQNIAADFVVPTVATALDVVVHVARDASGGRRVREVLEVTGRVEQGVIETDVRFGESAVAPGARR
jgi:pilus assembly protein CpaF